VIGAGREIWFRRSRTICPEVVAASTLRPSGAEGPRRQCRTSLPSFAPVPALLLALALGRLSRCHARVAATVRSIRLRPQQWAAFQMALALRARNRCTARILASRAFDCRAEQQISRRSHEINAWRIERGRHVGLREVKQSRPRVGRIGDGNVEPAVRCPHRDGRDRRRRWRRRAGINARALAGRFQRRDNLGQRLIEARGSRSFRGASSATVSINGAQSSLAKQQSYTSRLTCLYETDNFRRT
jgi:hypothetical protein